MPWFPLAAGFLSGKDSKNKPAPSDTRGGAGNPMNDHIFGNLAVKELNWATLDAVRDIATSKGVTPSQVAYSWIANRPGVIAHVMGARTLDQLEQNLVAGDLALPSAPTPNDYPYGPFGVKQRERYVDPAIRRSPSSPSRPPAVALAHLPPERTARLARAHGLVGPVTGSTASPTKVAMGRLRDCAASSPRTCCRSFRLGCVAARPADGRGLSLPVPEPRAPLGR